MWSTFGVMAVELIIGSILLFWLLYIYFTSSYTYWKDRSISYIEPRFPFGTDKDIIFHKVAFGEHYKNLYNKFKNEKMIGAYMFKKPYLLIRDPELIKHVMVKDFHNFVDRGMIDPEILSPVMKTVFHMEGEPWKTMRSKLSPAFTSGKMKMMFHLMEACAKELSETLHSVAEGNGKVDMKDFIARYTTDVISSCAFGLESNSIKDPDCEFMINGKKIFAKPSLVVGLYQLFAILFPWPYKLLRLKISNDSEVFLKNIVKKTVEYRDKNGVFRNDFIDLMMKLRNNKSIHDEDDDQSDTGSIKDNENAEAGLTMDEITAQAFGFFAAGFETAASTMTFCLYEISLNPDIQQKMRQEIDHVLRQHSGKVTYQALQEMTYMEAVINETLRRYASLSFLNRKCTEDYKIPESNLVIPKGIGLVIPIYAIHHDPKYYPDPYKFDPERFLNDGLKTRNNFTFLPFGEGPRMCIANRFGMMQMKTCLSMMIHSFLLSISEDTPVPVRIDQNMFITTPETPIILKISNRVNK